MQNTYLKSKIAWFRPLSFSPYRPSVPLCCDKQRRSTLVGWIKQNLQNISLIYLPTLSIFREAVHFTLKSTGDYCEHATNGCASSPCKHGGTCKAIDGEDYECVCPAGRTGRNCQKSMIFRAYFVISISTLDTVGIGSLREAFKGSFRLLSNFTSL